MRKCCFNPAVQRERELRGENIQRGDKGRRAEKKGTKARSVHIFPLKKVIRASNRKGLPSQDSDAENVLRNSGKLERALGKASSFASNKKKYIFYLQIFRKNKRILQSAKQGSMSNPLSPLQLLLNGSSKTSIGEAFELVFEHRAASLEDSDKARISELFKTTSEETEAVSLCSLYFSKNYRENCTFLPLFSYFLCFLVTSCN